MKIALFGSGSPISVRALEALTAGAPVVAVIVPGGASGRGWRRWLRRVARSRGRAALVRSARRRRLPCFVYARGREAALARWLQRQRPDLICVATFPHLLPQPLLELAPCGALGLHPSLLPRHRGPDPVFWTYHAGDEEAGVSVFWLDESEDAGDLAAQEAIPVRRGCPGAELYAEVARRGAALLSAVVGQVAAGRAHRRRQEAALATREPLPRPENCAVDLRDCAAEWLWHFLCGVGPRRACVSDAEGRRLLHGPVRAWSAGARAAPGTVERLAESWRLHCRDGFVEVEPPGKAARLLHALRGSWPRTRRPAPVTR